jgi:hypothetical protein
MGGEFIRVGCRKCKKWMMESGEKIPGLKIIVGDIASAISPTHQITFGLLSLTLSEETGSGEEEANLTPLR